MKGKALGIGGQGRWKEMDGSRARSGRERDSGDSGRGIGGREEWLEDV